MWFDVSFFATCPASVGGSPDDVIRFVKLSVPDLSIVACSRGGPKRLWSKWSFFPRGLGLVLKSISGSVCACCRAKRIVIESNAQLSYEKIKGKL
jgi:hypothetical protein